MTGVCGLGTFSGGAVTERETAALPFDEDIFGDTLGSSAGLSFVGAPSGLRGVGVVAEGVLACILARRSGLSLSLKLSRSVIFAGSGPENMKLYSTPWATTRSLAGLTPDLLARRSLKAVNTTEGTDVVHISKLNW